MWETPTVAPRSCSIAMPVAMSRRRASSPERRGITASIPPRPVTYTWDATDRIAARQTGSQTIRYGSTGTGDAPDYTANTSGALHERTLALPGGVLLTKTPAGNNTWP
jgi:hypothetical protein